MVDIMKYLMKVEGNRVASANYMSKQSDINAKMREILVDWLVEVHLKFKLRSETLFLTVNLIDRFLERRAVNNSILANIEYDMPSLCVPRVYILLCISH